MKIFGYRISLAKNKAANASAQDSDKRRATNTIRKQPKREVSFQINDIKTGVQMALNADEPNRGRLHDIYRYVMRDGHLKSQIRHAKIEAIGEPWMLYKDDKPDEEISKLYRKRWMTHIIEYILESEFHGYSVIELTAGAVPGEVNFEVKLIEREYVSIERQWILIEGTVQGAYLPYADIKWDIDLLEFGKRDDLGSLLECAYNVIWKYYSRSDWSRTGEKFGMPILAIEAETQNDKELDALENRAANFGSDGYIVTQAGDKVNIIERTGQNVHLIFKDNIQLCNEEISKIINGQTGTSDQKAYVGAAEVHERVMGAFTMARLQMIADEFNEKVLPYLVYKGVIVEGYKFDYPALVREREKRLNGQQTATDAKQTPAEEEENKAKPKPAKEEETDVK